MIRIVNIGLNVDVNLVFENAALWKCEEDIWWKRRGARGREKGDDGNIEGIRKSAWRKGLFWR